MRTANQYDLSVFKTFKTKTEVLTEEAIRQRSIIAHLATNTNSALKTRTGISQSIAEKKGVVWKNIYSGIFRDLDKVLIPLGLVKETGRLPLKRGPRVMQQKGIPYYELTPDGLLVALSLSEISDKGELMKIFLSNSKLESELHETLEKLAQVAPKFTFSLFEKYVKAYCKGKIEKLTPFDIQKLKKISDNSLIIQKELLEASMKSSTQDKKTTLSFLKSIS